MRRWHLAFVLLLVSSPLFAQTPTLASRFTAPVLADLPTGGSLYSVFDTMPAEVISDRIDTGGLFTGEAARIGSHGSSWTQTLFRLGDFDITNQDGSGSPLLVPGRLAWDHVDITTGLMPIELNAPGMGVILSPRMPADAWTGSLEYLGSGPSLLSRQEVTVPPAIARQHSWHDGSVLVSGPLIPHRLGMVLAAGFTDSTRYERDDPTLLDSSIASMLLHLVFTPTARDEMRAIFWADKTNFPHPNRVAYAQPLAAQSGKAFHGQATWERRAPSGQVWAIFGSFGHRRETSDVQPSSTVIVERLRDGPVPELFNPVNGSDTDNTWSVGGRLGPAPFTAFGRTHTVRAGIGWTDATMEGRSNFSGRVGELISGVPARIWQFSTPAASSMWSETLVSAYATDTIQLHPRFTLDAGIRFETVRGAADGSASRVSLANWFPRGSFRWELTSYAKIAAIVGFARYGDRVVLSDFAYGDPAAPVANVYRWDATASDPQLQAVGPLVARIGPGTGGDDRFSTIDPKLVRPYMDEFVAGFESRPKDGAIIRLAALARREKQLLGVVDVGAPVQAYSKTFIIDTGTDHAGNQPLPVFDRLPATFGQDRYLLTNQPATDATFVGVEFTMQATMKQLFLMAGATAGRSEAPSGNVGFGPLENDQGVLGEVFVDPNARTYAIGRVFSERGYTIKTAGVWTLPWDMKLGFAARYQDGQHFARLVIVQGLNQGAEAIRAFPNGATRFTMTATLDGRFQKSFAVGKQRLVVLFDAYNILNNAREVEEYSITGPASRLTSAVQPPRAVHLGLRLNF